ncbi:hypothetical protein NE237_002976 [Protea cynaroides]|uniref:Uncharacterized protein n=1 Tax=Protea cynaroides TaxID=273540 RepID=A0A9Q0KG35_9MAGN|nr:hypothetical protein NE237_002976 [Protea cynaroides]
MDSLERTTEEGDSVHNTASTLGHKKHIKSWSWVFFYDRQQLLPHFQNKKEGSWKRSWDEVVMGICNHVASMSNLVSTIIRNEKGTESSSQGMKQSARKRIVEEKD